MSRIFAASCPTTYLSAPLTVILFSETSKVNPSGAGTTTGWENPKERVSSRPLDWARNPTPTNSSSFFQPTLTPQNALLIRERVSPCKLLFDVVTIIFPSLCETLTPAGTVTASLPLGPETEIRLPSKAIFTSLSIGNGLEP